MHADPKLIELTSHKRRMLGVVLDELFAQIDQTDSQYAADAPPTAARADTFQRNSVP